MYASLRAFHGGFPGLRRLNHLTTSNTLNFLDLIKYYLCNFSKVSIQNTVAGFYGKCLFLAPLDNLVSCCRVL